MCAVAVATVAVLPASAQPDLRSVGVRAGSLIAEDAALPQGSSVAVTITGRTDDDEFQEGLVEALLDRGFRPLRGDASIGVDYHLTVVWRGEFDGSVRITSVVQGSSDQSYVSARAYTIPRSEPGVFERLLEPLVVTTAALLVVYLLLTIRSS